MAGMATYYHSFTGDTYLAGLWKKGIEKQLLWSSIWSGEGQQNTRRVSNTRPSSYRAPSWSWVSLDGPIYAGPWMGDELHNISIRVVDAKVNLLHVDQPFGGVQNGSLTIECGQLKQPFI